MNKEPEHETVARLPPVLQAPADRRRDGRDRRAAPARPRTRRRDGRRRQAPPRRAQGDRPAEEHLLRLAQSLPARRRWTDADDQAVLKLRGKHPYMGKARLRAMLARDGLALSVSTVGRILSKAIADGRIKPASFCEGRIKPKRRRNFDGAWANRWRHGDRARAPGEMVQVDHMTFSKDGRTLKEFRAVCPVSKFMASRVFSQATAGNAVRFLQAMLEAMPFPVASIQVDGGSEFRAGFERACQQLAIPLHVLPPRRPQWNGCVERANRSARTEFWSLYAGPLTVADVAPRLAEHEFFHNYRRPHWALDCRTPNEYLVEIEDAA